MTRLAIEFVSSGVQFRTSASRPETFLRLLVESV
jgi:hypothetical protein